MPLCIGRQDRKIHIAESDFDTITLNRTLCDHKGEIGLKEFESIMRMQITLYMQTQLTNFSPYRTQEEIEFTQIATMKMILTEILRSILF